MTLPEMSTSESAIETTNERTRRRSLIRNGLIAMALLLPAGVVYGVATGDAGASDPANPDCQFDPNCEGEDTVPLTHAPTTTTTSMPTTTTTTGETTTTTTTTSTIPETTTTVPGTTTTTTAPETTTTTEAYVTPTTPASPDTPAQTN